MLCTEKFFIFRYFLCQGAADGGDGLMHVCGSVLELTSVLALVARHSAIRESGCYGFGVY